MPREAAAIRAQFVQEIQTLPEGDLQPRAIAILKAKNRLSADDANEVEEIFAARMALLAASPEALATEEASTLQQPKYAATALGINGRRQAAEGPAQKRSTSPAIILLSLRSHLHQRWKPIPGLRYICKPTQLPPRSTKAS